MKNFSIILILVFVLAACAQKRTAASRQGSSPRTIVKTISGVSNTNQSKPIATDTTVIVINTSGKQSSTTTNSPILSNQFDEAVSLFNTEQYNRACPMFISFIGTLKQGDSLYYEAIFFHCECLIIDENINRAESMLNDVLNDRLLPNSVLEKILVRLGHIYCFQDRITLANRFFTRLRNEFPNSRYIAIANCDAVAK